MPDLKVESTLQRPLQDLVGRTLSDRYRIDALLGRGGAGAVYAAQHLATGARVAIKALLPGAPNASELAARLQREAGAAQLIEHPNVVAVHELLADGGDLYLVMELLDGRSLAAALEAGALAPARALAIAREVAGALGAAHDRGVIHRDLKPGNIMLLADDRVKLLDFGLAKLVGEAAAALGDAPLTQGGLVFGTPAYVAPEQVLGQPVDGRADLYALGIVLFEMLTGRPPFRSPDPLTLTRMHTAAPAPTLTSVSPRAWPPELEGLLARALAKRPPYRFATAADLIAAIDTAARAFAT